MNRAIIMKDRRLIEALDYIDDEYIASAALYKMRAYAESARPLAQTAGQSIKKHWKHYLGFVACLLVLALATPLFTHLPEIINSFAAGWVEGSETLKGDETTDFDLIETTDNTITTPKNDNTYIPESEVLHESVITPNYLNFISDLEPITEDKMLEIRNAWCEYQWNKWFDAYYSGYIKDTENYTESEARKAAEEKADAYAKSAEYVWFTLTIYNDYDMNSYYYRYYGMIDNYVVLAYHQKTTFNYSDEILNKKVGDYIFHFKSGGDIYLYKDGTFNTIQEVYDQGLISDEDVATVYQRHNSDYVTCYENWKKEAFAQYFAEKGE